MTKNKKISIVVLIVLIIITFCTYKKLPFFISDKENPTTETATEITTESHILTVKLNKAQYEIEYNSAFDISEVDVSIEADDFTTMQFEDGTTSKTYDSLGEKIEWVTIVDTYNDYQTVEITINVVDIEAPIISGVMDCRIIEGRKFNALGGVSAIDNVDGDVSNTLVCSEYDSNTIGTQTVTISATDKSGNVSSVDFELEVSEKTIVEVEPIPILDEETISNMSNKYKEVIPYDGKSRFITCWGDSLTEGHGASNDIKVGGLIGATETTTLEKLTGIKTYNMGISGEDSRIIACRQGGMSMYVNNITIPASGSVTFSHIMCEDGDEVYACRSGGYAQSQCFDACIIGGITGKLTYTSGPSTDDENTGFYTFNRAVDGTELIIDTETAIITPTSIDRRDDILVLEMGNNIGWDTYEELIDQYNSMIEYSNCKYFIIVGDTDSYQAEREHWDKALELAFGDHFIRMREYLAANGLNDCGLEATDIDKQMMENVEVPDSLKSDWSHLNSYGYYSKGLAIYQKGVQLGYWK